MLKTIELTLLIVGFLVMTLSVSGNIFADELVHKFKSPSFNGINSSAHYLTIENQEFNRKAAIEAEIRA